MIDDAINQMSEYEKGQDYVHFINGKIQDHLFRCQDIRVLPSSQSSEEGNQVPLAAGTSNWDKSLHTSS